MQGVGIYIQDKIRVVVMLCWRRFVKDDSICTEASPDVHFIMYRDQQKIRSVVYSHGLWLALEKKVGKSNIVEDDKNSSDDGDDGICCYCAKKLFSFPSPQKPQFPAVEKEIAKKNSLRNNCIEAFWKELAQKLCAFHSFMEKVEWTRMFSLMIVTMVFFCRKSEEKEKKRFDKSCWEG